ncbi:MAG: hypothetical protein Q8N13_11210 [Acidovorax sp.]|nr:hypothetical protein [Acidovorax sp.]
MNLISHIPGVGPTALFNPGVATPAPWNVAHTGATDGSGPATATKNMAEIYNRLLLQVAATIQKSGLAIDNTNWTQLAEAVSLIAASAAAAAAPKQIQPILATVAANALTLTLSPTQLDFRSPVLSSGTVNSRTIAAPISLVVPAGATLGTVNGVASRVVVIALDNAGVQELAVVNISGGNNLDETTLISTTAITAAADVANVAYSTVARASLPFRVVGYVDSTQAVAGDWVTAPSTIQGVGGQALAALSSLGYGQTHQDVTGSRVLGTTYYNTTGKPIHVHCICSNSGGSTSFATYQVGTLTFKTGSTPNGGFSMASFIVPPGKSYTNINPGGFTLVDWFELR